jgi:hypothetical protein
MELMEWKIMNKNLVELSFERLKHSDWELFENTASAFLATEFSTLRSMASASGDGGRDSELFCQDGNSIVAFQYSVTVDWKIKIRNTVKRLEKTFPDVKILIYVTSQKIGALADDLRKEMSSNGIHLDVRDRGWFLDRCHHDNNFAPSTELINRIARPYLAGEQIIEKEAKSLDTKESKAAFLYLNLQLQDSEKGKGFTKIAFEGLVRAVLRGTHSENRMSREEVFNKIELILQKTNRENIERNTNSALAKLEKKYIRHWKQEDEFCLTHAEVQRLEEKVAKNEIVEIGVKECVERIVKSVDVDMETKLNSDDIEYLVGLVGTVLDRFAYRSGEDFVACVASGSIDNSTNYTLKNVIFESITNSRPRKEIVDKVPIVMSEVVFSLFKSGCKEVQDYLKCISNAYTLLSFLRQTPDVQKATQKLFSHGELWLDTTVVLPLLAEQAFDEDIDKPFSNLFKALTKTGSTLRVTEGVISEILSHMKICEACSHKSHWEGRIPYLYSSYVQSGRIGSSFSFWLESFRGKERPSDDIAQYLQEEFSIVRASLEEASRSVPDAIRWQVERMWQEAHDERRGRLDRDVDPSATLQLVKHDVENYLGVLGLRKKEETYEFGYKYWWLTLDSLAWRIRWQVAEAFVENPPSSPLISLGFIMKNLYFGPARHQDEESKNIPIWLGSEFFEDMPDDILSGAEQIREEYKGLPERVIRRKIRDGCDHARRQMCEYTLGLKKTEHIT